MSLKSLFTEDVRREVLFWTTLILLCSVPLRYAYSSIAIGLFIGLNLIPGLIAGARNFRLSCVVLIVFFLWAALSFSYSMFPDLTISALGRLLPIALIPLTLIFSPKLAKDQFFELWKIFGVFISVFFFCFLVAAFFKYRFFGITDFFFYHDLVQPFKLNAIYVSFLLAICLLILLSPEKERKIFDWLNISILIVFLIMLSSKLVISFFLIGYIIQLISRKVKWYYPVGAVFLMILALILVKPLQTRVLNEFNSGYTEVFEKEEFSPVYPWTGTSIRLLQARVGSEILDQEKAWITGVGLGASQPLIKENQEEKKMYHSYGGYNFHNQYMQILVELGIIGLLIYLFFLVRFAMDFRDNIMVLSLILLIFGLGFTESFLWRQQGLMIFLIVLISVYQFGSDKNKHAATH